MKSAVVKAKLGQTEEPAAIRRPDEQAQRLDAGALGPCLDAVLAEERARSHDYGGRSIFGHESRLPSTLPQAAESGGAR
jgi:hypothetical protein